ncbi:Cyanidin 3-O-glucoside 5-O-glucosyltransferase [Bienertia sinuspersici]
MSNRLPNLAVNSCHISFLVWNVQGAGSNAFLSALKELIRVNKPSVVALVETHMGGERAQYIATKIGFDGHLRVDATGFSGGIWLYWKMDAVTVSLVEQSNQYLTIDISRQGEDPCVIKQGAQTAVGNGRTTLFWDHKWAMNQPLIDMAIKEVPDELLGATINEMWCPTLGWQWDKFAEYLPLSTLKLIESHELTEDITQMDAFYWNGASSGEFTIKSAIKLIRNETHMQEDPGKPCEDETVLHTLRDCKHAFDIWKVVCPNAKKQAFFNETSIPAWISNNIGSHSKNCLDKWALTFPLTLWWIWKWRNMQVFQRSHDIPDDKISFMKVKIQETKAAMERDLNHVVRNEDVQLMVETGLDAYRFSISWSRLIPNGRGPVNPKGLRYYNNLINELIIHGIEPHVTLVHSDVPQILEDEYGSFLDPRIMYAKQHGLVGINFLSYHYGPLTNTIEDIDAARRCYDFMIGWFMHPLTYGDYPQIMKETAGKKIPVFTKNQSNIVKGSIDFVGLNYYTIIYTKANSNSLATESRDFFQDMAVEWTFCCLLILVHHHQKR